MKLPAWFVGEFFGTFLLVFFGCGAAPFQANGAGWFTVYIRAPLLGGLLGVHESRK